MHRKEIFFAFMFLSALITAFGCGRTGGGDVKKNQPIVIPGGTVSPTLGIGFDAYYDPSLDGVVPGYKILTVAYTNNTMNLIQMDSLNDQWYVIDKKGRKIPAVINLRRRDPDVWATLPKKLKVLIEYPLLVQVGATVTIDLLIKSNADLIAFKEVWYRPAGATTEYRIIPREH